MQILKSIQRSLDATALRRLDGVEIRSEVSGRYRGIYLSPSPQVTLDIFVVLPES